MNPITILTPHFAFCTDIFPFHLSLIAYFSLNIWKLQ